MVSEALSKNCSFGDLTSSLIKDRIIVRMQNNATRQKLLSEKGLTLEKCIEIARSYEATRIRMKAIQDKGDTETVNQVQKPNHKFNQDRRDRRRQVNLHMKVSQNILLKSVISVVETITSDSPAQPQTVPVIIVERKGIFKQFASPQGQCVKCKMMNHQVQEKIIGAIHNVKRGNKEWSIEVCLDNTRINFKIDTGADVDIISDKIYMYTSHFSHKPLLPSTKNLKVPDRKHLPILGYIKCSISKGDKSIQSYIYVMKGGTPLLGRESSVTLGAVALIDNIQSHPQLFKGLGETPTPYKIELQQEAQPYSVQ